MNRFLLGSVLIWLALTACSAGARTLYWTDVGAHKIQRWNLESGPGVEDLVVAGVWIPADVAVDGSGGKVYWTEASPADFTIFRANLDGSNVEALIPGLGEPSGIALDPAGGKIYWTTWVRERSNGRTWMEPRSRIWSRPGSSSPWTWTWIRRPA